MCVCPHGVCVCVQVAVVEVLLEGGANRECKDVQGKTAKDLSASHGHKTINMLLAGGKVPSECM